MQKEEIVIGVIEKILYVNEENNYHVLNVETLEMKKETKVTITQPNIYEGLTYEFKGEWTSHPKFGKQFKANFALEKQPSTKEGLRAYLQSSFFSGIGPVIANRIVEHFGEDVIKTLNENPDAMLKVPGISKAKLKAIKETWEKNHEMNDIMIFLRQHGISNLYATKIYEFYGKNCVAQILNNPYKLTNDISGIGFTSADKIALSAGFKEDSVQRVKAAIAYVIEQASNDGHCYLLFEQITTRAMELLKLQESPDFFTLLMSMERSQEIKVLKIAGKDKRYYDRKIYFNETYCCEKIHALLQNNMKVHVHEDLINSSEDKIKLSEEQALAVKGILGCSVSVLTGGPGTGKSTITKKIVDILLEVGKKVVLAAPTGRAAKRMTEVIGKEATTIHRLLSWDHINGGFLKNEGNPISADVIIIDESSMKDINLAASLLKATPYDAQIIFIGDADQLEPVGPGNFFKDLIKSNIVPIFKLNRIFRQGKESLIIKYAHEINTGVIPNIETPLLNPDIWTNGSDCVFVDSGLSELNADKQSYPAWSSLRYGLDVVEMTVKLYIESLPKYIGKEKEIQILIPMNVGDLGNAKMNEKIQAIVNPPSSEKGEIKLKDRILREGDKVIHTKNNYDLEVYNGDIGRITDVYPGSNELTVKFSDDREVDYKKSDILDLDLAYSISIHKAQGSEFDCVIMPIMNQYYRMLFRNLIYTGLTRAKKFAVFVGQRKALETAVNNFNYEERQTSLKEMFLDGTFVNPFA
jgi:exodeoxyribonuclease V alpha subunit